MTSCDLCDLPTPPSPIVGEDGDVYCCEGCKQIASAVESIDAVSGDELNNETSPQSIPDAAADAYFRVNGMHCTTCEAYLAYQASRVDGVYGIEANYGLETARVYFDPCTIAASDLPAKLSGAGYQFVDRSDTEPDEPSAQRGTTIQRLIVGGFFTMLIMPWYFFYLYPIYVGFDAGLLQMGRTTTVGIYFPLVVIGVFTTIVLLYTGFPVLRGAWVSIRVRQPNMDLLVAIAALAAYAYSVLALALGSTHLYFDVTVMVIMVVTLGRYYESGLREEARGRLSELTRSRVESVVRLTERGREAVHRSTIVPGDHLLVEAGGSIPFDGTIVRGQVEVDESLLTGESLPVAKGPGDSVVGGSMVIGQPVVIEVGPDATSTIDRIASAMWEIQADTAGVQRIADRLATVFVPIVLMLGIGVTGWQLFTGGGAAQAMLAGLTILLVSCPCAMGLATPLAVAGGLRDALDRGLVIMNETVFEAAPDASAIVFDKTGTLTRSEMVVDEIIGAAETLERAAAVEQLATHPISHAILEANTNAGTRSDHRADGGMAWQDSTVSEANPAFDPVTDFEHHPGEGVSGTIDDSTVVVGSQTFVREQCERIPGELIDAAEDIERSGGSAVLVGWDDEVHGVIGLIDRPRDDWDEVLERFSDQTVTILTGDSAGATEQFRSHPAVDQVFTGIPPDAKVKAVEAIKAKGPTVMIGDGTNDAPALAAADLGIAMGDGAVEATDAADVIIVDESLGAITDVFSVAQGTRRRIRENIGWALLYNAIALPLAIVGMINPFFAALAMAVSSIIVVTNSRRPVIRDT